MRLRRVTSVAALAVSAWGLVACGGIRPPEHTADQAPLELERYFSGKTRSWGSVEDRFGKVRQTFVADLEGAPRGGVFHLDQTFHYADGRTERRQWVIRRVGDRYLATADGIQGTANGSIHGGAVHLDYTLATRLKEREVKVRFDQWLWRQEPGVLFNRVDVRKFGILVARVSEVFEKTGD